MADDQIQIRDLLLLCLSSDDEEAWFRFVRRTQPFIASVIIKTIRRWRTPDKSKVDDLIQDTYVKLFTDNKKALRNLRNEHENAIFGYLRVIASNVVLDHFRQRKNDTDEVELSDQVVPPSLNGMKKIEFDQRRDEINCCLEKLLSSPTHERDMRIFSFYYDYGYTAKEISMLPGIELSIKGVEAALLRLSRFLSDEFGTAAGG